jgi:hypothetical protein
MYLWASSSDVARNVQPSCFKPINADLNPICHLLALSGAHHILQVSRIRVKLRFERKCGFPKMWRIF